ncbi:MAG TPA: efflux RND transporter periplasmic adaptor subunit [Bryobacteraceae bacterium]|nr:efflux RND transporter periplasmic adaptor subunit [Bryobacteraceae bacterium]
MKSIFILIGAALLAGAAFMGGIAYRAHGNQATNHAEHGKAQRRILYYVDPMHPAYTSDKPGIAPDCGMKLEPVYEGSAVAGPTKAGMLNISQEKQQMIGVEYGQVTLDSTASTFRAVGKVSQDETRVVRMHTKFEGWIEKVHVDFTGARVEKGQPLLTIYSPELFASEQEFLLALQAREILKTSPLKEAAANSDSLIRAARTRLELWDLTRTQIDEIEKTGKPQRTITLFAPVNAYVAARNAFPSQKVTPESELYTFVDLSRVWVIADVFESDAAKVRVGQSAVVGLPFEEGKGFVARVSYIQPQVDPATRTMKVRLDAPNPKMQLKPDMFVDVEFQVASAKKVTVPAEAVLDAGLHKTVFVDHGDGYLEPRQVEIGQRMGDRIEILKGLKPGERIVTSGNFLIDSESQLKQAAVPHAAHSGEHAHD